MEGEAGDGDGLGLGLAVEGVAQHRVTQVGEVDADLVGAPGLELCLHQRGDGKALEGLKVGHGRLAPVACQGGAPCRGAGTADGAGHGDRLGQVPRHQGQVAPRHGVGAELALEVEGRRVGARQDQDARGIAVEAVHDEEPPHLAPRAGQGASRARQYGVLLGVEGGVDEQPRGLVHHHHVLVLVEDGNAGTAQAQAPRGEFRSVRHAVGGQHPLPRVAGHRLVDRDVALHHFVLGAAVGEGEELLHHSRQASGMAVHTPTLPLRPFPQAHLVAGGQAGASPLR